MQPADAGNIAAVVGESLDHLRPWMPWATKEAAERRTQLARITEADELWESGTDYIYAIFAPGDGPGGPAGKLGGVVDIASDVGIGTKMTITLPITLAIIHVLLVEIGSHLFAVPLASVEEAIVLDENQVRVVESREVLTVRGSSLPICRLARLFGLAPVPRDRRGAFVVIAQVGARRLGFVVDELVGQQDIVIKPLGKSLKAVRGFAGATELGDQRIALVIDVAALIEEVLLPSEVRFLVSAGDGDDGLRTSAGGGATRRFERS